MSSFGVPCFDATEASTDAVRAATALAAKGQCDRNQPVGILAQWWRSTGQRFRNVGTRFVLRNGQWEPVAPCEQPTGKTGTITGTVYVGELINEQNAYCWPEEGNESCEHFFYLVCSHYLYQLSKTEVLDDSYVIKLPNGQSLRVPIPQEMSLYQNES